MAANFGYVLCLTAKAQASNIFAGAPLEISEDLLMTFNISIVARGSVSETGHSADDGSRYRVPHERNIFRSAAPAVPSMPNCTQETVRTIFCRLHLIDQDMSSEQYACLVSAFAAFRLAVSGQDSFHTAVSSCGASSRCVLHGAVQAAGQPQRDDDGHGRQAHPRQPAGAPPGRPAANMLRV
jgi:hypothetical protein